MGDILPNFFLTGIDGWTLLLVWPRALHGATSAKGALGYLAPEYASAACDAYSFGVLLLELATGKKPLVKPSATGSLTIADWALPLAHGRKLNELVDQFLGGNYVEEEWRQVLLVGLICAHNQIEKRPTMLEVVELLKAEKEKVAALENDQMFKSIPGNGGRLGICCLKRLQNKSQ